MLTEQNRIIESVYGDCNITCIVTGEQWKQNTYIVHQISSSNTIIIDPGDNADIIINRILVGDGNVTRILLTHPHHDHVGAAAEVSEHFGIECELHKNDLRLLKHAPMYAQRFANKKISSVVCYQLFEELESQSKGPMVTSLHTPGHTKGSVCYLFDGFVFTGDTLLYKHIGRTDFPGSCADELSGSVSNLLRQLRDDMIIFPGHGKPWSIGEAKAWWQEEEAAPATYNNFDQL
jgi:glyoxylase-like metal-dependent hydrolase (beta-lactamase superfamily II)